MDDQVIHIIMPNRQLTAQELQSIANPLLKTVRDRLLELSGRDVGLLFALRRKLAKELTYDERGKPLARVKMKIRKRAEQGGRCAMCQTELPERGAVLDRVEAMAGYTPENTRLLCPACDAKFQHERGFK